MDYDAAVARLGRLLRPEDDPVVSGEDVAALLADHGQAVDVAGVDPSDVGWVPTYSVSGVYRAAAEGWSMKAASVVGRFDFSTDGQQFRRSQVMDHCEAMVGVCRRKANASVRLAS